MSIMKLVYILENVPLSAYTTMRLGGTAAFITEINTRNDVTQAIEWAEKRRLPVIMIGAGSNTFWSDDGFNGLVLVNKIHGITKTSKVDNFVYVTAGAGESWDDFVEFVVNEDLTGAEQLSLIPGTVGATPIQNVGAYGREVSEILTTLEAYDKESRQFVTLKASDCAFGYRTSRFKTIDKNRFFITAVTYCLSLDKPMPPFYSSLQDYIDEHPMINITPRSIREAVIQIRKRKLPDPAIIANNGSFFANPIVSTDTFFALRSNYQDIYHWNIDDEHVKLSAAWLIEQAGFKGIHDKETGMAIWPQHALILVNEHAQSTADLLKFKQKVIDAVYTKYGVKLEQEPEILP